VDREQRVRKFTLDNESPIQGEEPDAPACCGSSLRTKKARPRYPRRAFSSDRLPAYVRQHTRSKPNDQSSQASPKRANVSPRPY
jgi:hypothetical protein